MARTSERPPVDPRDPQDYRMRETGVEPSEAYGAPVDPYGGSAYVDPTVDPNTVPTGERVPADVAGPGYVPASGRRFAYLQHTRWQDWANLILGAWIFISAWVFSRGTSYGYNGGNAGYNSNVTGYGTGWPNGWNAWITGAVIFIAAAYLLAAPRQLWLEWVLMAAGVWLFISPWVIGFAFGGGVNGRGANTGASWNDWICGAIVFGLALWAWFEARRTITAVDGFGPTAPYRRGFGPRTRRPVNP